MARLKRRSCLLLTPPLIARVVWRGNTACDRLLVYKVNAELARSSMLRVAMIGAAGR